MPCTGRHDPASTAVPPNFRITTLEPGVLRDLREAQVVARRVAERRVDAVRTLLGRIDELDAAALELLVGRPAVVGGEEDGAGRTLARELLDLLPGLRIEDRRPGDGHQRDRHVVL